VNLERLLKQRTLRRCARRMAPPMAGVFAWSFTAGPVLAGITSPNPLLRKEGANGGHVRRLSAEECARIVGATATHALSVDADSGSTYPWEGSVAGTNTGNGNKQTGVPIVGWTARGGMPVALTLYHNSQSSHNSELGQKWTFSYDIYLVDDGSGNMTVHWGDDLAYPFTRNIDGSYTPPTGVHDKLVANGSPITSFDLTTKDQVKHHFTNPNGTGWYVATIADRNGNTVMVNHNASDFVTSVVDPTGRTISLTYTGGLITSVSDPLSRSWSISYSSGNLTQVTWPSVGGSSYNEQFGYNAAHDITSHVDKRGHSFTATYNTDDSLASETDACSNSVTYSYSSGQTVITDANSHTVKHNYSSGRLSSVEDQAGVSESYSYDSSNNRTGLTDRRGHSYSFTFDSNGNMLTKTDPLSHVWTWTWNTKNEPLTETDPLSHVVTSVYDSAGNLTSVTDGLGHATTFTVDSYGNRLTSSDALSHCTTLGYDADGNLTSVLDANANSTSAAYDALGVKTSVTDALSHTTSLTFDNWERVTTTTFADTSTIVTAYDPNSNVTSVTDQNGHATTTTFDNDNRPLVVTKANTDAVTFAYDSTGKKGLLSTKTDGNSHVTTVSYNSRNLKSSVTYPDSSSESWTYDANGNLASHVDCKNQTVNYVYDNADRLTTIDYPTGTDTTFSYDNANRRTQMVDSTGTTSWVWDAADRLTSCTTPGSNVVAYSYDNANRRTGVTLNSTQTWTYGFDSGNRLTSVANPFSESSAFTYDAANRISQQTAGNSSVTLYGYNSLNRTTDVWHKTSGGTTLGRYQYTFDSAGNVTQRTDNDGSTTAFGYDNADQLTSEIRTNSGNNYSISYTYDHNSNRKTKVQGGVTDTYSYDSHDHLTSTSSKSFSYDLNGNCTAVTTGGATTALSYDYENRVTGITYPSTATNSFQYNGLGLRTRKVDSTGTVNYVCDGADAASPVLADTNATYTPGLSERRGTTSKFLHSDALGTTRGITNSSQTATDGLLFDAFGMTVSRAGTTPTAFGFVGAAQYQTDADSGLLLLGHRYYDASIGRFISSDPAHDGDNWYAYCGNNPLGRVDPRGEFALLLAGGAILVPVAIIGLVIVGVAIILYHDDGRVGRGIRETIGRGLDWIGGRVRGIRDWLGGSGPTAQPPEPTDPRFGPGGEWDIDPRTSPYKNPPPSGETGTLPKPSPGGGTGRWVEPHPEQFDPKPAPEEYRPPRDWF